MTPVCSGHGHAHSHDSAHPGGQEHPQAHEHAHPSNPEAGIPEGARHLACLCGAGEPLQAVEEVRWLESFTDLDFPPVPFPSRRIYQEAGEEMLRTLVLRHHVRLKETHIGNLFPLDLGRFMAGVAKTADFVVEACGGPEAFTPRFGPMRMRDRHFPFTIDERAREVWLQELLLSFADVGFPETVREEYWNWVEPFSIRMINRRTAKSQPRRHPYAGAAASLGAALAIPGGA